MEGLLKLAAVFVDQGHGDVADGLVLLLLEEGIHLVVDYVGLVFILTVAEEVVDWPRITLVDVQLDQVGLDERGDFSEADTACVLVLLDELLEWTELGVLELDQLVRVLIEV